jgi:hypothetical protein
LKNVILFKVEEFVMLVDPKLSLFTGDETTYGSYEADRPQHRITQFRFVTEDATSS